MLADTHCHLNFHTFDGDRDDVLARARLAGVHRILVPGIDLNTSEQVLDLAGQYQEVFAAIGVHPNDTGSWESDSGAILKELQELAKHEKVVAIGEIGLDYYRDRSPKDIQEQAFLDQLRLAAENELPVVIHSRNASEQDQQAILDILEMLGSWVDQLVAMESPLGSNPGVLHSFSSGVDEALAVVDLGFKIGITGPVTFKNAEGVRNVVRKLPLESLLIETDAPFLTPYPYRGKRNEPAYVKYVAERIALEKDLPLEAVLEVTTDNANKLFIW